MNEPRFKFEERMLERDSTYRFYDDRIECDWTTLYRKGKVTYPVTRISGRFSEQTTFAYGLKGPLTRATTSLLIALVLQLGFTQLILNRIALIFYALAGLGVIVAATKLRKDKWIYVDLINGGALFGIRESALRGASREDFIREIRRYTKVANQLPDPTSPSVTPPAGAGGAPSVAADH
jgi:hypothetical protein